MNDDIAAYWAGLKAYLRDTGNDDIELRRGKTRPYFRIVQIVGVPISHAHFAVVATKQGSVVRDDAANRVQLVLEKKHVEHYLAAVASRRATIDSQIPGTEWVAPERTAARHVEVRKEQNLDDRARWTCDFKWLLDNLHLFQQVLEPHLRAARQDLHR